jgi:hypothetical protein
LSGGGGAKEIKIKKTPENRKPKKIKKILMIGNEK